MRLIVEPQPVPLSTSPKGVVRISGTRVTLDTVVGAFLDGATPETIAQQYPSLQLADVYAVLGYYASQPTRTSKMIFCAASCASSQSWTMSVCRTLGSRGQMTRMCSPGPLAKVACCAPSMSISC